MLSVQQGSTVYITGLVYAIRATFVFAILEIKENFETSCYLYFSTKNKVMLNPCYLYFSTKNKVML